MEPAAKPEGDAIGPDAGFGFGRVGREDDGREEGADGREAGGTGIDEGGRSEALSSGGGVETGEDIGGAAGLTDCEARAFCCTCTQFANCRR